ncbi:MAG: protein-L-isoaspartate O-methyltransferase [Halothiobacillus sp.]|jgi:protein-L-isoaspartate(D-aspartate) O-methyltransferase|nr:protein-L-isoaspartate O-methyltransferase [Halothiobacillus sp.]
MMAFDTELARFNMVEQQIRPWDVLDKRVLETLFKIPREQFVPAEQRNFAFSDTPLLIGHGETMLPPVVEGRILQALAIEPQERILEIGTGTGFLTACLAHLGHSVHSVDIHPDFTATAAERLKEHGIERIVLETGDALNGWAGNERFDIIVITGAVQTVAESYRQQLNVGGRLFAIVGTDPIMSGVLVTRQADDHFITDHLFETRTRYLHGAEPKPHFSFA